MTKPDIPADAEARRAALDPARSFVVQAPAGSGKTELLTDRILALLCVVDEPEEIAAITFTRKAAAEMHARVLSKLEAGQGGLPDAPHKQQSWRLAKAVLERDKKRGWNLLAHPARLSIRTIDSFCAWLVGAMPWLSALGGLPGITESARAHYLHAARATLDMADDEPSVRRLLAHLDVDVQAATQLVADMLAQRDQWLTVLVGDEPAAQLPEHLQEAVQEDLQRLARRMPVGWADQLAPWLQSALAELAGTPGAEALQALQDWSGQPLETDWFALPQWQALAGALLTNTGTLRRTVNKNQGFGPANPHKAEFVSWLASHGDQPAWVGPLGQLRRIPEDGYQPEQLEVLGDLARVLILAAAQLQLCFARAAEVDFVEISQRALLALGTVDEPTDLLLALDTRLRHILVDEFQDTSQTQIDLLKLLTAGWQPGDGHTLFLVGDPMQSIYRFRKAEVGWFLNVREHGLPAVALETLVLSTNFRSQANLVQWVNGVFGPLFPAEPDAALGAIPYSPAVAYHPPAPEAGMVLHPIWAPPDGQALAIRQMEEKVVDLAREALARHAGSERPVAILVRARTHLQEVVRRMVQAGIPCRAVELVPLRHRQAVADAVQLARALLHPADRLAWLSVLRSPLCGLTLDSLHALFGADHASAVPDLLARWVKQGEPRLPQDEAARLAQACAVLLQPGNASGSLPLAAWLQTCWERLGGPDVHASDADRADVESLWQLIETLAPYGSLDMALLDERLEQLYAAPQGDDQAVQVMTMHKAKGLEFDTVILMGLHRRPRSDTEPLIRIEQSEGRLLMGPIRRRAAETADPISDYLAQREKQRASLEADRLLYVAATRARQHLHVVALLALNKDGEIVPPAASSMLGRLWPHLPAPQPPQAVPGEQEQGPQTAAVPHLLVRRAAVPAMPLPLAPPQEHGSVWNWSQDDAVQAVVGTVAHAWLEHIGREGPQHWSVPRVYESLPLIRRQLSRAGLALGLQEAAAEAVAQTLEATLSSERGQWLLRVARAQREWSLLDLSGRVSVIDLAISEASGWLVVDYKTGQPAPGESADAFAQRMRMRHGEQLARYCHQVSALDGRPARGALYFPRADLWVEL